MKIMPVAPHTLLS